MPTGSGLDGWRVVEAEVTLQVQNDLVFRYDPTADAAFSPPVFVPVLGAVHAGRLLPHQLVTYSATHLLRLGVLVFAVTGLWLANRLRIAGSLAGASGESGDRHPPAQH